MLERELQEVEEFAEEHDSEIAQYFKYLLLSGRTSAACNYYYRLKKFAEFLGKNLQDLNASDFKPTTVEIFKSKLNSRQTVNCFLSAARGFLAFLRDEAIDDDEKYVKYSRMYDRLKKIKLERRVLVLYKKALTRGEAVELLTVAKEDEHLFNAVVVHLWLGARPVELARPFKEKTINLNIRKPKEAEKEPVIDYENGLINIITAKTKNPRIIPIHNDILPYFESFFENHDIVLNYFRPREWLTRNLKKLNVQVTAKTFRYTFETLMSEKLASKVLEGWSAPLRVKDEDPTGWIVKYWIGHLTDISNVYRDYTELMSFLREEIVPIHYLLDIL